MDPHRVYTSVCAVMVCLLGATRLSVGVDPNYQPPPTTTDNCRCPKIPPKDLTVPNNGCFNNTYRYECIPGYTRKPGMSGLIRCQEKNGVFQWTDSLFKCIIDPNYQPPPTTTAPPGPSSTLQSIRTSTSEPSVSPNTERNALGSSSTLRRIRTSTSEPSAPPYTERNTLGERTTVCISLVGVILFVVLCGVIFFLYRQRKKPIPRRDPLELEAMNADCDVERLRNHRTEGSNDE